jgi:hypothetical protein
MTTPRKGRIGSDAGISTVVMSSSKPKSRGCRTLPSAASSDSSTSSGSEKRAWGSFISDILRRGACEREDEPAGRRRMTGR